PGYRPSLSTEARRLRVLVVVAIAFRRVVFLVVSLSRQREVDGAAVWMPRDQVRIDVLTSQSNVVEVAVGYLNPIVVYCKVNNQSLFDIERDRTADDSARLPARARVIVPFQRERPFVPRDLQ